MTKALCLVLLGLGLLPLGCSSDSKDGGSTDPVAQCKDAAKAICAKFFGCYTKDELSLVAAIVGNNEADCNTKLSSGTLMCTTEGVKCDSGETYDASAGSECLTQIKALSCDEFKADSTATPAACDQTCK